MREEKSTKKRNFKRTVYSIKEWAIAIFETLIIIAISIIIIAFIEDKIQTQIIIQNSNQDEKEILLESGKIVTYSLKKGNLKVTLDNRPIFFSDKYHKVIVNPDGSLYLINLKNELKKIDLNNIRYLR